MEQEKNLIMVTWDFTEKSLFALKHAVNMSHILKSEIALLHVVKKDSEIGDAEKKMEEKVREIVPDTSLKFRYIAREGTIFHTIGEVATEVNALMVLMGTHGIKGMQKLLGSWALKVIASSKAPFIVVQDEPKAEVFKNIIIPISYRREVKECITWAHFFSRTFNTKFIAIRAKYTDSNFKRGVESNTYFLSKYFTTKNIRFEIKVSEGEMDFGKEIIAHAKQIEADAILVMTTRDIGFADYVLGPQEQYIIANSEKIPVICINPRPIKIGGGFSASGG
ncbi:MAG: universal stress protein [Bacteroidales bacterium]|nr:universal stress protein [Bacteroidales bacterium]MBN2764037.1 universal stress protein [Bacteroidales bacterium]